MEAKTKLKIAYVVRSSFIVVFVGAFVLLCVWLIQNGKGEWVGFAFIFAGIMTGVAILFAILDWAENIINKHHEEKNE